MTEPLAREKVEQACAKLQDLYPHLKNIQLILNIDAALRRRLAEMTAELDVLTIIVRDNRMTNLRQELAVAQARIVELEQKYKDVCSGWDTQYVTRLEQHVADLTAKLAQMEQQLVKRDRMFDGHVYVTNEEWASVNRQLTEAQDENRRHRQSITIMQRVANELITEAQNAKVKL